MAAVMLGALSAPAINSAWRTATAFGCMTVTGLSLWSYESQQHAKRTRARGDEVAGGVEEERWAMVSGASTEFGAALAKELAERDFNLVLLTINEEAAQQLCHELKRQRRTTWL